MARGGKLDINIDYVKLLSSDKAALRAVKDMNGGGHTGAMVGGICGNQHCLFPGCAILPFYARKGHKHSERDRDHRLC